MRSRATRSLGLQVAVLRASMFVLGSMTLQMSGLLQVLGYTFVLVGLPELLIIRGLRDQPLIWTTAGAALVFAGSFLWVSLVRATVRALWERR